MTMDARPSHRLEGRHRGREPWLAGTLGLLLAVGVLVPACTDNKGPTGPSGQQGRVATTGDAFNPTQIRIIVTANPASTEPGRRVEITVLVTNANGLPLEGRLTTVAASTAAPNAFGTVDGPQGRTDANGIYRTTLVVRCADAGISTVPADEPRVIVVRVDAYVDGAIAAVPAFVNMTGPSDSPPCPGSF